MCPFPKALIVLFAIWIIGILIMFFATLQNFYKNQKVQCTVAKTIWLEARGEGYVGMEAVATVIYNRSVRRKLSLVAVCLQEKQFSCWNKQVPKNVRAYNTLGGGYNWDNARRLAGCLLRPDFEPMDTWTHYYNPDKCTPYWASQLTNKVRIGHHIFGTIDE